MPGDMEKKILMELLEKLISEMDDHEFSSLRSKGEEEMSEGEPVAIVEEKKAMPLSEAKDEIESKIESAMNGDEPSMEEDGGEPMFSGFTRGKRY